MHVFLVETCRKHHNRNEKMGKLRLAFGLNVLQHLRSSTQVYDSIFSACTFKLSIESKMLQSSGIVHFVTAQNAT